MEVIRFEFALLGDDEKRPAYQIQFEIPDYMDVDLEYLIYNANQEVKNNVRELQFEIPDYMDVDLEYLIYNANQDNVREAMFNKYVLVRITKFDYDLKTPHSDFILKEEYSVVNNKPILQYKQDKENIAGDIKSIW